MKRKSIKEVVENPKHDEFYVLVTRYFPMELRKRGMSLAKSPIDIWDRTLAPSRELLRDVNKLGIDWIDYVKRFTEEEVPKSFALKKFSEFKEKAKGKEVVLVCIEEDDQYPYCHTWILLDYEKGFDIETLK